MERLAQCLETQLVEAAMGERNPYEIQLGKCAARGCAFLMTEEGGQRDISGICRFPGGLIAHLSEDLS